MRITFLRFTAIFAKICFAKIKCYYEKRYECYEKFCSAKLFGLRNHKNKFCKNFFLSLIGSTAFKLSDLLNTFLFFRLFDNALMKAYSLYGRRGGKKSFKETKICEVIVTKWILFIWRFFLLSQKTNWVSSISFLHYESLKKKNWKRTGI